MSDETAVACIDGQIASGLIDHTTATSLPWTRTGAGSLSSTSRDRPVPEIRRLAPWSTGHDRASLVRARR